MKSGTANINDIRTNKFRFDCSFHLSDAQRIRKVFENLPYKCLTVGKVASRIFNGGRYRRVYVNNPEHGYKFLSSSDILSADLENVKMVSRKYMGGIDELGLQKGWTLITRSGTIGKCAFANAKHAQKLASEHVIRLVPNNILREGVIYAFLASRYGYALLTQGTFGAVIQHIEPDFVASLPIPEFPKNFQEKIDGMIQESARLREEAVDALAKAVNYFDNIYTIQPQFTKTFKKSIKDIRTNFASYNNNIEVDEFILKYIDNSIHLGDITAAIFAPPLFKHIYLSCDNGHPFMTGSELTQFNLRFYRWLSPRGVKNIQDYKVKEGTLLLYKSGTTDGGILGNVFIADNRLDGCCLSDHVIRVVFKDKKMAYWAFAFLRSKGAVKMLQRLATGTMIPFITPDRVEDILIPNPDEKYEYIVDLVSNFISWSSKSKKLELDAIQMVEAEIEKWNK